MENGIIIKQVNQSLVAEPTQLFNANLYDEYISYLDATEKTIQAYKRAIRQFANYCSINEIKQPTRTDILNYRNHLLETCKPTTTQAYIIAIRLFFNWTALNGLYPNIAEHVKGAKISKDHKKDNLTEEQAKKLIKSIDGNSINDKRDKAIISIMLIGGLRTIEIQRANIEDIRPLANDLVLYVQGKGKNEKTDYIKLTKPIINAITEYLQARGKCKGTEPLFASLNHATLNQRLTTKSISRLVKEHLIKIGINSDRITAHSLRHTTATLNLLNGGTLEETQQLLRHTNINTTMIYLHHLQRINNNSEQRITNTLFDD